MIEEKTDAAKKIEEAKEHAEEAKSSGPPTMHIKIYSPFRTYFDEDGFSLSGVNATGPFDILPHHHNFLSLLEACELIVRPLNGPKEQRIRISGGLMHVKADKITVFLDI
jgi:F0F1-type ATP synthase epsilon subunit